MENGGAWCTPYGGSGKSVVTERFLTAPRFQIELPPPPARWTNDFIYPPRQLKRGWTHRELLAIFPLKGIAILDVGAGHDPFHARERDELVTVDFDGASGADYVVDVTESWPFAESAFDFIYLSHVVEHFYPAQRDRVIRRVYDSVKPGGFVFIRVPHRSSIQATGWEHHTQYGVHGATSLCHGRNPLLPMFRVVSAGLAMSIDFYGERSIRRTALERALNARWRLTESLLCYVVGGIAEVQFLLQRMPPEIERRLRGRGDTGLIDSHEGEPLFRGDNGPSSLVRWR
jgi:predicted SAM-dependent methyltransferase